MSVPSKELVQRACDYVAAEHRKRGGVFVQFIYDKINVADVSLGADQIPSVSFTLHTVHEQRNSVNMVHGGASSTMVALYSQLALAADKNYWQGATPTDAELAAFAQGMGTTRSIDVQIIQAVPLDADITIKCRVLSSTKSNAYVAVEIFNPSGRLVVSGVHDIMKLRHPAHLPANDAESLHATYVPPRL